jgi:pullulanase/glycogen debranching enzyme
MQRTPAAKYATAPGRGHLASRKYAPADTPAAVSRAEYVFKGASLRVLAALLLTLAPGLGWAGTAADPLTPVERGAFCDPALPPAVLHAAAYIDTRARAYWLDRDTLQWPGASADGARFRLYRSATAALRAVPGRPVEGADGDLILLEDTRPLAPATAARFGFIGPGPRLRLPPGAEAAALLRAQLLLVREDRKGRVLDATHLQHPGALDDLYAAAEAADDLGAVRHRPDAPDSLIHRTDFTLWAPTARQVSVCVYPQRDGGRFEAFAMQREDATGLWRWSTRENLHRRRYAYLVEVYVPGVGIVRNRVTDPYSNGLSRDSVHSVVLDMDDPSTQPEGWDRAPRPAPLAANVDMGVYELHVRDFSLHDATVRADWRGKYWAFTQPDSAGMRHLRALAAAGITDIHLLPSYDLGSVPEQGCKTPQIPQAAPDSEAQQAATSAVAAEDCFNWGYDPWHYNVPEGSYATDATGAQRIREFRAMVQALHAQGLRVGLDVVYNHTYAAGQDAKSVLDRIVPGYYHRLNAEGAIERSTCCENTATEHRMMAKLMIDSAVHWVRHYRIDSFRFDLMGHQPRAAMERLQATVDAAAGRRVQLLGEGWNFGEVADGKRFVQASQRSLNGSDIATFSDRARDALRGGGCCDGGAGLVANQGLLNGLHVAPNAENAGKDRSADLRRAADLARVGLAGTLPGVRVFRAGDGQENSRDIGGMDYAGQRAGYASTPNEVVNYVENHDNMTLFDINAMRLPRDTPREERARAQLLGVAFTAFSQGVAYYHAGVEILRSKSLDKNSFDSGDWFNRLDWTYTDNGFGAGLPPARDNGRDWEWMRPVLADARIKPRPEDIRWMRDASLDLLRIRAGSSLFRLRSADEVQRRLTLIEATGEAQSVLFVGQLDGRGHPGANARSIVYLINVSTAPQTVTDAARFGGRDYVLHPVHRAAEAADTRAREAAFERASGRFTVPARTAVVFVEADATDAPAAR